MSCPVRSYPFRKPPNHRVPIPRYKLTLSDDVNHVCTAYIGVQNHHESEATAQASKQAINAIQEWLARSDGPAASESFVGIKLDDCEYEDIAIWVCYWSDPTQRDSSLKDLSLLSIHSNLIAAGRASIGLWQESFTTEFARLETNYSGLDYLPGLAKLPGADTVEHTLSAYWGAARDRIPDSAYDLFPKILDVERPDPAPRGLGQQLMGTNHHNLVHIRSGQYWEKCGQQEADAYELKLEPTLRAGLEYLRSHSEDTNATGIRYLRNENLPAPLGGRERKESCGAGFFWNLEDLERWAHTHQSHLKIYRGALSHYKAFGDARRFRTWHEVSVVKERDATFEYVNCEPSTGAMQSLRLQVCSNLTLDGQ